MIKINAANQNYDDDLYHNPIQGENNSIDVSGAREPETGNFTCISGMRTLAVCGLEIRGLNVQLCDDAGCTPDLFRYSPSGAACQEGDSGAPVYHVTADNTAVIQGMHIGEVFETPSGCVGEKISNIRSHLSVTVATAP